MMETASTNAEKFEWLQHWVAGENVQHLRTQVLTNGQTQKGKNGKLWKTLELWNFETRNFLQNLFADFSFNISFISLFISLLVYQLLVVIFTAPLLLSYTFTV